MHVLVTGGAGYIGSTLVPHLLAAGHQVTAFDRFFFGEESLAPAKARHGDALRLLRADVRSVSPRLFEGVDALVDLAGISNDPACELDQALTVGINLEGGLAVHAAAQQAGVSRIVFASSCSVYGHGASERLTESSPLHPVSLYARCKVDGERGLRALADRTGITTTALRFATVFGLSGRTRFDVAVNVMTKNAYVNRKITVDGGGKQWRPFVHVLDVAETIRRVLAAPAEHVKGQIYNVGSDRNNLRILNLAYRIRDHVPGCEVVMAPTDPDLRDYNVSFSHLEQHLGFVPEKSIDDGIREVLEGLREGRIDPDDRRWYTLKHYLFLAEVERTYRDIALEGRVLG
jgi:nucleoside-diphosphate-sugar epimerase